MNREELSRDLASVLNRHNAENGSNTPDYILADYLVACLEAWNLAAQARDTWYDIHPAPGGVR